MSSVRLRLSDSRPGSSIRFAPGRASKSKPKQSSALELSSPASASLAEVAEDYLGFSVGEPYEADTRKT